MKISLQWLKDYVALPESVDALAEVLTSGGTEVVGRVDKASVPDKVVVARILSSEQHPNADRLSVCQVDDGSGQPRQIVCGAKNYKVGDLVPLALPGAVLGPDFKIKAGKLRGVVSEGMMCSAKELGLAEDAEGLLILPPDATVGKAVKELFAPDTVLELEVTPNRPDLLGYRGVAREVAALTNKTPCWASSPVSPQKSAEDSVRLEDTGCPYYTARVIRGVKVGPSPDWLAARLVAAGLRPISNIVDVTNYVLLETGQPLHAFDLGKLSGSVRVRAACEGEKLPALDGSDLTLRAHDLVIADNAKAIALAGVMGGSATGVTSETTDILLESAWFEPARVRRTARELGLQTDSSYRFERRVDAEGVLEASARAVELIIATAGGIADAEVLVAGAPPDASREIVFSGDQCRALLGAQISDDEMSAILTRLGLTAVAPGRWSVPSFRSDLTREVDLCEEVVRMAGIERVPSRLRGFPAATSRADIRHDRAEVLRERLRAQGFSEARTSHFVSLDALGHAGLDPSVAVAVRNPLGADQAMLRPTLLAGLLDAMARNLRHGVNAVRLFELGRVFATAQPEERSVLGLIATGPKSAASWQGRPQESDFFDLKGILEEIFGGLVFQEAAGGLSVRVAGEGIDGILRRLPSVLAGRHEAKSPVYYAELHIDGWLECPAKPPRATVLPKFPAAERDLSFVLPLAARYAQLEDALRSAHIPHLRGIELNDVFVDPTGGAVPAGHRALTVTLTFRDDGRTLTSEEVDRAVEALRDRAKAALGATFRG